VEKKEESEMTQLIANWAKDLFFEDLTKNTGGYVSRFGIHLLENRDEPTIKAMFASIDWDKVAPRWFDAPETSDQAWGLIKRLKVRVPEFEPTIAKCASRSVEYAKFTKERFELGEDAISLNGSQSCIYSIFLGERFEKGEPAIAADQPEVILTYAKDVLKDRFKIAEDKISCVDYVAAEYGDLMRDQDLWGSWTKEEVKRSPVWLYQYAKDYIKGKLPEDMHVRMLAYGVTNPNNEWIRKYSVAKKYKKAR